MESWKHHIIMELPQNKFVAMLLVVFDSYLRAEEKSVEWPDDGVGCDSAKAKVSSRKPITSVLSLSVSG